MTVTTRAIRRLVFGGMAWMALLPASPLGAQEEPVMPGAPEMFRLGAAASFFAWPAAEGPENGVGDLLTGGVELEAVVSRWIGFRLGVGVGATTITATSGESVDARQYLVELLAAGRLPVGRLAELGVTPWAEVGVGTLVHQPTDTLRSRNQNTFLLGLGADVEIGERVGVRTGWRTLDVEQADVFDPEDRGSRDVRAHRIVTVLYWRF